jgi:hypothetical protein
VSAEPTTSARGTPGAAVEREGPWARGALNRAEAVVANPLFAYGAILVLQLRVIWNVWRYKDVTSGDTSSYFLTAASWAHDLQDNIVWSPLYTSFLGTVLAMIRDVPATVMVHRVLIVVGTSLLVLACMRSLLGPALGLLGAIWWVVLPPNFDVTYEIHLFGILPILVAVLLLSRAPGLVARGIAFAILFGTTILLRNELVIATAIVAAAMLVYEVRNRRSRHVRISQYVFGFGIPLAVVCLLAGGAYWRSYVQGEDVRLASRAKHELNMCQVYAFNYQERHPTKFRGNPWVECAPLMRETFGKPMLGATEAAAANPGAVAKYVAWNLRLLPSGLQVALFGATSTGDTPDFLPVAHGTYALLLSILAIVLLLIGLTALISQRAFWRTEWLPARAWAVIALSAVAITTLVVVIVERPRPEYMYGLTLGLIALTGIAASALVRRFGGARYVAAFAAGATIVLALFLPPHYHSGPRPLRDALVRLHGIRATLQRPESVLLSSGYGFEICSYLAEAHDKSCRSVTWATLKLQVEDGKPLRDVLAGAEVTAIYADPLLKADPVLQDLLARPSAAGWRKAAEGKAADGPWSVLIDSARS